ncbi:aminotransferase class III-fold pyridoxal phosphate-dependent enzyme, partial [Rosenbergiella collisarenosi]
NQLVGKEVECQSVFFTSGAEAVENAVKIARGYTQRPGILAFDGAFHGRTLLASTLTGMSSPYKQNFGPFAGGVYRLPYPNEYRNITE